MKLNPVKINEQMRAKNVSKIQLCNLIGVSRYKLDQYLEGHGCEVPEMANLIATALNIPIREVVMKTSGQRYD